MHRRILFGVVLCSQGSCHLLLRWRWYEKQASENEKCARDKHKQQLEEPCCKEARKTGAVSHFSSLMNVFLCLRFASLTPAISHSTHIDSHTHTPTYTPHTGHFVASTASSPRRASQGCGCRPLLEAGAAACAFSFCCQHSSFLASHGAWRASCPRG